jgi:hypothetical protein
MEIPVIHPDQEYEYKPRWSTILLIELVTGVLAVIFVFHVFANGWRINNQMPFFQLIAAAHRWSLVVASLGLVLYGALLASHRAIRIQRIVVAPTAIVVPRSQWSSREIVIPYSTITALSIATFRPRFSKVTFRRLTIAYPGGRFVLHDSLLPSVGAFEEIHRVLNERRARGTEWE